ncbi:hypothetical protein TWF281_004152 [Arthrobotrys megalospora]
MSSSLRSSVGLDENPNISSPTIRPSSMKEDGQNTIKDPDAQPQERDQKLDQGRKRWRKVPTTLPPAPNAGVGKKGPKRLTDIKRARKKSKYPCPGCPRKFTVKREYESHYRRCVGEPINFCTTCGQGITRRHNMKKHFESDEHKRSLLALHVGDPIQQSLK